MAKTERALAEPSRIHFRVLSECEAADTLFKGIDSSRHSSADRRRSQCRLPLGSAFVQDRRRADHRAHQTVHPRRFQQLALAVSHADAIDYFGE